MFGRFQCKFQASVSLDTVPNDRPVLAIKRFPIVSSKYLVMRPNWDVWSNLNLVCLLIVLIVICSLFQGRH